ncbi:MAG: DNA topoisomerase 3 [Firmicutes bacterium ADurb.Bin373]|nr:MAG: DNA topoisomerase 3 [Firmicutes bacterium ADurb.Bin373]
MIVKRFIAVLSADFKYKEIKIVTDIEGEHFFSRGKEVLSPGWKEVYGLDISSENMEEDALPEQTLKEIKKGEKPEVKKIVLIKSHTKAPGRLTEADLLSRMEKANLGTPATRAEIIEKIISSFYVERNGKQLSPTSKGKQLVSLVPDMVKSADLTSQWENYLELISKGKAEPNKFMADIRLKTRELIEEVKSSNKTFKLDNITKEKCPMCGKYMLSVTDKRKRAMLICQDRECGYRENVFKKNDGDLSISKKEKAINKKLISQYSDNTQNSGLNLGDLLKNFIDKK